MQEAGASLEVVALVAEEIEAMQAVMDARKLKERDRKREKRLIEKSQKSANGGGQSGTVRAIPPHTPLSSSNLLPFSPTSQTLPKKVSKDTTKGVPGIELPDWLPAETWAAFLAMRKSIKKPASDFAQRKLIAKLERLNKRFDAAKLLERSIINSWQDIYEPRAGEEEDYLRRVKPTILWADNMRDKQRG